MEPRRLDRHDRRLREIFGRKVDLLSLQALRNPFRRHEILKAREILYAA